MALLFQKRHHEAIAEAFRLVYQEIHKVEPLLNHQIVAEHTLIRVMNELVWTFSLDNAAFNARRFREACGYAQVGEKNAPDPSV